MDHVSAEGGGGGSEILVSAVQSRPSPPFCFQCWRPGLTHGRGGPAASCSGHPTVTAAGRSGHTVELTPKPGAQRVVQSLAHEVDREHGGQDRAPRGGGQPPCAAKKPPPGPHHEAP